jgi:hypothetical protein
VPPNFTLKLVRPASGPGLKPLGTYINVDGVTPSASSRAAGAARTWQTARRSAVATWALAAQLSV